MYDEKGQLVWETRLDIYGKVHTFAARSLSDCPFRYQGQYEDVETGLYYNRFRYYSPEEGIYLGQDPIGLAGNNPTLYSYVHDSNSWVDRLGLAPEIPLAAAGEDLFVGTYNQVRTANIASGLNETHTPHHVVQNALSTTTHGRGITINIRKDLHELTRTYSVPIDKSIVGLRDNLAADIKDLRKILLDAGYDRDVVNRQLQELIRQNKALGGFDKSPKASCH
jgi:RHS repeat-associated protein